MCGAAAIGAVAGVGQAIVGYQAEVAGVKARNKAKLKNFERQNVQYLTDSMLRNAQYKQDQIQEDVLQDQEYMSLMNIWNQNRIEIDKVYYEGDRKLEGAIREMYQNDYAGTQTGATAARLASQSTQELGFKKASILGERLLARKDKAWKDQRARDETQWKSWDLYENIRYAPQHGHAPVAPFNLEAKPSPLGMIFGAVSSAAGAFGGDD